MPRVPRASKADIRFTHDEVKEIFRKLNGGGHLNRRTVSSVADEIGISSGQLRHRLLLAGYDIDVIHCPLRTGEYQIPSPLAEWGLQELSGAIESESAAA